MKILFDTDPGIDDAMALLMLARDPRAELVGVTTVFGNAPIERTTANALALCERFGIEVPVARGADRPLQRAPAAFPEHIHGADAMGEVGLAPARRRQAEATGAAEFIGAMARRHAGELTIVAVGPFTNLALALDADPALVDRVRRVVVMGGAFGMHGHCGNASPVAEANVWNDPHAADRVLGAGWPVSIVGLDVTHEVLLSTAWLDALGREGGAEGAFIREITRFYERAYFPRTGGGIYSHDASAVACALDPSAFTLRAGPVRVVLDGSAVGQTIQRRVGGGAAGPGSQGAPRPAVDGDVPASAWEGVPTQQVAVEVDAERLRLEFRACFVADPG